MLIILVRVFLDYFVKNWFTILEIQVYKFFAILLWSLTIEIDWNVDTNSIKMGPRFAAIIEQILKCWGLSFRPQVLKLLIQVLYLLSFWYDIVVCLAPNPSNLHHWPPLFTFSSYIEQFSFFAQTSIWHWPLPLLTHNHVDCSSGPSLWNSYQQVDQFMCIHSLYLSRFQITIYYKVLFVSIHCDDNCYVHTIPSLNEYEYEHGLVSICMYAINLIRLILFLFIKVHMFRQIMWEKWILTKYMKPTQKKKR